MRQRLRDLSGWVCLMAVLFRWADGLVVIALSPILILIVVAMFLFGSDGSLDERCEPRAVPERVFSVMARQRFWSEQVDHLDRKIEAIKSEPVRNQIQETELLLRFEEEMAKLSAAKPELFAETNLSPAQPAAAALRDKADEIEHAELVRIMELQRLDRLAKAEHCRHVAFERLGDSR